MSDIKRYDIGHSDRSGSYKDEEPDGEYVEWEDHASAISAKDSKIAELEEMLSLVIENVALWHADYEPDARKLLEARLHQTEPANRSEDGREVPDVVAWLNEEWGTVTASSVVVMDWDDSKDRVSSLMTVAQHSRIAKQLREEAATAKARQDHAEAARDVLAERRRQVEAEGWTPEHDDAHGRGAMALAAGCYARHAHQSSNWHGRVPESWPWGSSWWKPKTARENLVRAGALIIAEIERIDRAAKLKEQRDD